MGSSVAVGAVVAVASGDEAAVATIRAGVAATVGAISAGAGEPQAANNSSMARAAVRKRCLGFKVCPVCRVAAR